MLCVDVGSTFTKVCLVSDDGDLLGTAQAATRLEGHISHGDVMDGVRAAASTLGVTPDAQTLACSSAGGGLRLAVVGYERQVTAEAGRRVGLSAGARVVHVAAGPLDAAGCRALAAAVPDLVLLAGGTDGGNADVLRHNADALAALALRVPVVVAGNVDARADVVAALERAHQPVIGAANVVPRIGVIAPQGARDAIRAAFLEHVIGGKHLSADPLFARVVRAPTPDAVLRGVEVVAEVLGQDVLVVDVGGATTDVYSVVRPEGEDATLRREVVAPLWHARTVEGDLGMRWNADGVLEAAGLEGFPVAPELTAYARAVADQPGRLPATPDEEALDLELARLAAVVAVRRHGRPAGPGEAPRPLGAVGLVLGSGGVLRYADPDRAQAVVRAVAADHAGGWRLPRSARTGVDAAYLLFAVGLLAETRPRAARRLARALDG
ncbi:MAG: glutamate mutase L [Lapillicoccus sp.]